MANDWLYNEWPEADLDGKYLEANKSVLTESINKEAVKKATWLDIDGFDYQVISTFNDNGYMCFHVTYYKNNKPIVTIEAWDGNSPLSVIENLSNDIFWEQNDAFKNINAFAKALVLACSDNECLNAANLTEADEAEPANVTEYHDGEEDLDGADNAEEADKDDSDDINADDAADNNDNDADDVDANGVDNDLIDCLLAAISEVEIDPDSEEGISNSVVLDAIISCLSDADKEYICSVICPDDAVGDKAADANADNDADNSEKN